jgi:uncharacterized cupredoxin-like copper-binding protein
MMTNTSRSLLGRMAVATAVGLALVLGACGGGEDEITVATPAPGTTATVVAAGAKGAAVATAQTRAIGSPQAGTIPIWLTGYAILPWVDQVPQAGRHTFTVSNRGEQQHSLAIIQFDGDIRALPRSANLIATTQVKIVAQTEPLEPGREVDISMNLEPGRYVFASLVAQDYTDGMAAAFSVGGSSSGPRPKQPADGVLGVYVTEFGGFSSNPIVRSGKTTITVQNLGARARDVAIARWRGTADALPTKDGLVLLDGLQEVHRMDILLSGEEGTIEVDLRGGFSYVVFSLVKGEYEKGIHTQFRVN